MTRRDAGFTLLEIMVALVVFGLVMAGIAQTFKFGLVAWRQGPARTNEPENLAALDAALTRMITAAQPGSLTGGANQFAFATALPAGAGLHGALADAAIMVQDGSLIMLYRQHPPGIPLTPAPAPRSETLAAGVNALQLAYFGRGATGPATWKTRWKSNTLPILVRIHLELADGRAWPDLVVAPIATVN